MFRLYEAVADGEWELRFDSEITTHFAGNRYYVELVFNPDFRGLKCRRFLNNGKSMRTAEFSPGWLSGTQAMEVKPTKYGDGLVRPSSDDITWDVSKLALNVWNIEQLIKTVPGKDQDRRDSRRRPVWKLRTGCAKPFWSNSNVQRDLVSTSRGFDSRNPVKIAHLVRYASNGNNRNQACRREISTGRLADQRRKRENAPCALKMYGLKPNVRLSPGYYGRVPQKTDGNSVIRRSGGWKSQGGPSRADIAASLNVPDVLSWSAKNRVARKEWIDDRPQELADRFAVSSVVHTVIDNH